MASFSGTITTTGRSEAIRLDKALFKAHPEFRQRAKVRAHVIGPGHLLVTLAEEPGAGPDRTAANDPVVSAYLAFLERDMIAHPERLTPFTADEVAGLRALMEGVQVDDNDIMPEDVTF